MLIFPSASSGCHNIARDSPSRSSEPLFGAQTKHVRRGPGERIHESVLYDVIIHRQGILMVISC